MSAERGRPAAALEFNPGALVQLVIDSLYHRHGIRVPASANVITAVGAAGDLLRALHVEPTAAPTCSTFRQTSKSG